jgi:hypothetical protein
MNQAGLRRWPAICLIALLALLGAAPAHAISRQKANAIALAALKPKAEASPVIVFGLPKAVRAGQVVSELARPGLLKRPGKAAWLFWEDRNPGAMFQHDSVVLLVDSATGKVVRRKSLVYYPLIDGRPPPYLASSAVYNAARYHVFVSRRPARPAPAPRPRPSTPLAVSPGAFADDCILLVVLTPTNGTEESNELAGLAAWSGLGASLHVPAWVATAAGPLEAAGPLKPPPFEGQIDDAGLLANVRALVDQHACKDVTIYISGHGAGAPDPPSIQVAVETLSSTSIVGGDVSETKELTPAGFDAVVRAVAGKAKLKWIIDSCHAERMLVPVADGTSMIALGSSRATEVSYFSLNGSLIWGIGVTPAVMNPGMAEFTHGLTQGIREVAASDTPVSGFADLLDKAFARVPRSDRAAKEGTTHPVKRTGSDQTSIGCDGKLLPFAGNANELSFSFSCVQSGGPGRQLLALAITGFDLQLPGTRSVTNYLAPAGFSCTLKSRDRTNDTLGCTGALAYGDVVSGNIRMSPPPSAGMGASLYVVAGGAEQGPFALTGP